ncbi:MAG: ATP-binding protein [Sphingobacteriia bacterium]|nr:ATP-binding protein [Sphingobacteriia bacterium]NCC40504.1 ATP-binding protein [Gammaproteobacteria bacterium]
MNSGAISILLESDPVEVAGLQARMLSLLAEAGLDPLASFQFACAIIEAVNNCVTHAYLGVGGQPIALSMLTGGERIDVEIRDTGPPLPSELLQPREMPGGEAMSGRGWPIIWQWTDAVSYRREAHENVLTLTRRLESAESPRETQ